jgi:hypothetical protein
MRASMRWGSCAVVLATAGSLCGSAMAATASSTATRIVTVYPWAANGKLKTGEHVAGTVKGTCWTSSIAVASSDAYRCMTNHNEINDPCFAPTKKTFSQLACMQAPWGKVTLFTLTAPIPTAAKHKSGTPIVWADRLSNGYHCLIEEGTGILVKGIAMSYYCVPGKGWASTPSHTTQPWTVRYTQNPSVRHPVVTIERATTVWN